MKSTNGPKKLTHISQALLNPRQGDCFCLELDELISLSEHERKDVIKQLATLKESGISVIGMSTTMHSNPESVSSFIPVVTTLLPANNDVKQKAQILSEAIKKLEVKPKRMVFVSESSEWLKEVANDPTFSPSLLYHYEHPRQQMVYEHFTADNLEQYDTVESLGGGTQSTYKLTSTKNTSLPPLVLKHGASQDAIKLEILTNAIYRFYDINVPKGDAFNRIPEALAKKLNIKPHGIFQISEFIEKKAKQDRRAIISDSKKDFVIHALLGNIDITEPDNIIQAQDNKSYVMDSGSNFIFRALGEIRKENSKIVSEIDSLRTIDHAKKEWFGDISQEEIKEQVLHLIESETELEKFLWALSQRLDLPDSMRIDFLQLLSDRLDNLAIRFCPEVPRYGKVDRSVQEEETAAGVLTYSIHEGQPYVLLAKRVDNHAHEHPGGIVGLWDCFGGGSDFKDIHLHTTAAREVYEESNKKVTYPPSALIASPFHDIITNKNGKPFIYRMYLREHAYVDPKEFKDNEHNAYQWISVADLQKGLSQPEITDANNKQTISFSSDGTNITLYPEFYQLLRQEPVQSHLEHLEKEKQVKKTKTQSMVKPRAKNEKEEIAPVKANKTQRRFHSPEELSWQIKKSVLDHLNVMVELKERFKKDEEKNVKETKVEASEPFDPLFETQTELHMRAVLGDNYKKDDLAANVTAMIEELAEKQGITFTDKKDEKPTAFTFTNKQKEKIINKSIEFIENEKRGGKKKIYFYHGVPTVITFAYQVYSAIYQQLHANKEWKAFRFGHENFKPFANINEFIQFYNSKGNLNDEQENYEKTAISTNVSLFGSHNADKECTFAFFLKDESARDIKLNNLLKAILSSSGLPETLVDPLMTIYDTYYKNKHGGVLYQVGMDEKLADQLAYAAAPFGLLHPYKGTTKLSEVLKLLKEDLNSQGEDKKTAVKYLISLQARLMVPPHITLETKELHINDLSDNKEKEKTLHDFPNLISDLVFELMINASADTLHQATPFQHIFTHHAEQNAIPSVNKISQFSLNKAFEQNNKQLIIKSCREDITLAAYALSVCIVKDYTNIATEIIKLYPELKQKKIQFTKSYIGSTITTSNLPDKPIDLVEGIVGYSPNKVEMMKAIFGTNWMFELPKSNFTHTAQTLRVALETLPEDQRYTYALQYFPKGAESANHIGKVVSVIPKTKQIEFITTIADKEYSDLATHKSMFSSLNYALKPEEMETLVTHYMQNKPQFLDSTGFRKCMYNIRGHKQLPFIKAYVASDPTILKDDSLLEIVYSLQPSVLKDFMEYVLTLNGVNRNVVVNAQEWLLRQVPEYRIATAIADGNTYIFSHWDMDDTKKLGKLCLNPFDKTPISLPLMQMILIHGKDKEKLLRIFYGKDWQSQITDEDLIVCGKEMRSLEQLQTLFKLLTPHHMEVLCHASSTPFTILINQLSDEAPWGLSPKQNAIKDIFFELNAQQIKIFCLIYKDLLLSIIPSAKTLAQAMNGLSKEQAKAVLDSWQSIAPEWFKDAKNLLTIIKAGDSNTTKLIYDAYLDQLPFLLTSASDFCETYKHLKLRQTQESSTLYEACKSRLTDWVATTSDCVEIYDSLDKKQAAEFIELILQQKEGQSEAKIENIIKEPYDVLRLADTLNNEHFFKFVQSYISKLLSLSFYSFSEIFDKFTLEQLKLIAQSWQDAIPQILDKELLLTLFRNLKPEQQEVLFNAWKETISNYYKTIVIENDDQFENLTRNFPPGVTALVYDLHKDKILELSINSNSNHIKLNHLLNQISTNQCRELCLTIKNNTLFVQKLGMYSKDYIYFFLHNVSPKKCDYVAELCKDEIARHISTPNDFQEVLALFKEEIDISSKQRLIYDATKEHIIPKIKTKEDLDRMISNLPADKSIDLMERIENYIAQFIKLYQENKNSGTRLSRAAAFFKPDLLAKLDGKQTIGKFLQIQTWIADNHSPIPQEARQLTATLPKEQSLRG